MTTNKELGNRGEKAAQEYLIKKGYRIIAHNYRSGHLEIDLIAQKYGKYIFFEIKTRIKTDESEIETPLSSWQVKNLKRAIVDYCYEHRVRLESIRLDLIVILVSKNQKTAQLKHYENIF